jgi:hypothetical protein
MRWLIVFVAMLGVGLGQGGNVDGLITRLMTSGVITGFDIKAISRTGDAAGAALTRYVLGMQLDAAQIDHILWIVHDSFGSLPWVEHVADREPTATLSLLGYLDGQTRDAAVQKKISDERVFILNQVAKLKVGTTCMIANHTAANAGHATVQTVQMSKIYRLLIEPEKINAAAWPRMGDGVAGVLTNLIGTCTLDADDTRQVLNVVRWSFEAGGSTADQTLLLLQNLEGAGGAADIDATRKYVLAKIH